MRTNPYLNRSGKEKAHDRIEYEERRQLSRFLQHKQYDFIHAIREVDLSSHPQEGLTADFATIRRIRDLFSVEGAVSFHAEGNSSELVGIMHRAVVNKKVVLRTAHDIETLYFILGGGFGPVSSLVEHYVDTDEVLDVMSLVKKEFDAASYGDEKRLRGMLAKLYRYDMQGAENRGDDESPVSTLPLEIRMNFAGCFDEALEEEGSI